MVEVIGVIHLPPLPGSPRYEGGFEHVVEYAVREASKLVEGGVDAVIVENLGDAPYTKRVRDPATIAAMAIIAREVARLGIRVGINLLRNSGPEAAAIAAVSGASFIRVNAYCEPVATPEGVLEPVAREVWEILTKLRTRVRIYADVHVKHGSPIHAMDIRDVAKDCVERGLADALIVTGKRTGEAPNPATVAELAATVDAPVYVGSGVTPSNAHLFVKSGAKGFIVGTYFKVGNSIDVDKVRRFVNTVKQLAETQNT